MAINTATLSRGGVATPTFAAPTSTTETITGLGRGTNLHVIVGATTTTITVVRHGDFEAGDAVTDFSSGSVVSAHRIINMDRLYQGTTGSATVTFSQLTNVTACVIYNPLG